MVDSHQVPDTGCQGIFDERKKVCRVSADIPVGWQLFNDFGGFLHGDLARHEEHRPLLPRNREAVCNSKEADQVAIVFHIQDDARWLVPANMVT